MGRFEITNHGRLVIVPHPKTGEAVWFPRNKTQIVDDEELAKKAEEYSKYIGVEEKETPLQEMRKKELMEKARSLGIPSAANKTKAQLRQEIESSAM